MNRTQRLELQFLVGTKSQLEKAELVLDLVKNCNTTNTHDQNLAITILTGAIYLFKNRLKIRSKNILKDAIKHGEKFLHRVKYHDAYICHPDICSLYKE